MMKRAWPGWGLIVGLLVGCRQGPVVEADSSGQPAVPPSLEPGTNGNAAMQNPAAKTDAEWRRALSPEQYRVLRQKGTERAFSGKYWNHHAPGVYRCAGCGQELFSSEAKYDSGCGWPSYTSPTQTNAVKLQDDFSHGMYRTEVLCSRCGGHLGHVFDDGPPPTGQRYCINSAALDFGKEGPSFPPAEPRPPGGLDPSEKP
jgi:peptide-methionine (R)-S-oxide reductase